MADAFDRLKKALADRYTIERELGSGGMARTFFIRDLKRDAKLPINGGRHDPGK